MSRKDFEQSGGKRKRPVQHKRKIERDNPLMTQVDRVLKCRSDVFESLFIECSVSSEVEEQEKGSKMF